MFESENMNAVGKGAIINCKWKAEHEVAPNVCLDDSPTFRSSQNQRDCAVRVVKKLDTQLGNAPFVIRPAAINSASASG
jgi:hypothetical protein